MTELSAMPAPDPIEAMTVAGLRAEMALTLAEMGDRVGLSKSQMHEVERSGRASLRVALAIEALAEGRIDAAALCDDVKRARHAGVVTLPALHPSPGNEEAKSRQVRA